MLYTDVTPTDLPKLVNGLAIYAGWTATVTCTQAMVDTAKCTAPQLGTQVANPETKAAAANRGLRMALVQATRSALAESSRAADLALMQAHLDAISDPDLGN